MRTRFALTMLVCLSFSSRGQVGPSVRLETSFGVLEVRLDSVRAPNTTANFMRYVDTGLYQGGTFFRTVTMENQPDNSVKIEVIQGGISETRASGDYDPIRLETTRETGLRHLNGTISMARSSPHSATWSFFICIGDQPELDYGGARHPDGQGFAAFGQVTKGMDVARRIQMAPAQGQSLVPPVGITMISRISFVPDSLRR